MNKILLLSAVLIFFSGSFLHSQNFITGTVSEEKTGSTMPGATVVAKSTSDSTKISYTSTDLDGTFRLEVSGTGSYLLEVSYIGFQKVARTVQVSGPNTPAGTLQMKEDPRVLNTVDIEGKLPLATQIGDTTQYNADAFKVNKDAVAEDLISKMPGVTVENGTVKAQGEEVKKVLVDGKPFFGDDANAALKNLPAEIIDKIQVYDKLSDQSEFTGFDDGNTTKTINIVTKKDRRNGQFGKIYGGLGTDYRYSAGVSLNLFDNDRKISILGMSNNINQQNFSSEDLVGVSSSTSQRGGNRGGGGGGGGGMPGGQGGTGNFLVGQQNGISTTHAFGVNYTDVWGKKKNINVTGSYFFNYAVNNRDQLLNREYFLSQDSSQFYREGSNSESQNFNHRVNLRFEFNIDSSNSLIFTPRFSLQDNRSMQDLDGETRLEDLSVINTTSTYQTSNRLGYNAGGDLLFRHKFGKRGRTFSISAGGNYTSNVNDMLLLSGNVFYSDTTIVTDSLNQQSDRLTTGYRLNSRASYTEPLGKSGILFFDYNFSYDWSRSFRETNNYNTATGTYSLLDSLLSNTFENRNITNRGTAGYRLKGEKFNFMVGVAYENVLFDGWQFFPVSDQVSRVYHNVLPSAMFRYRFTKTSNLNIFYRTSAGLPTVNQLQSVIDNTNPLLLSRGNPDLVQNYSHTGTIRYMKTNTEKATALFFSAAYTYTHNYIANSTLIASRDTVLPDGTFLGQGAQLSMPVNLDGYMNARGLFTYGLPISKIKTNLNINTSLNYSRTPGLINDETNYANSFTVSQGIVFSSNISEKIDFSISYTGSYNVVVNTLRSQNNNNYFNQTAAVRFNWQFWKGFVVNTNLNHTYYSGLSSGFDQTVFLWNASLGYKFLKDESLELKATVFDILGQNNSVSRTVTETYVEDLTSNVLQRYFMVTLTYNLRNFTKSE